MRTDASLPPWLAEKVDLQGGRPPRAFRPVPGECWLWLGGSQGRGYGWVWWNGRKWFAHRLTYTLLVGEIPEGLQIDRLCQTKLCVNPAHLEPVTLAENSRRRGLMQTTCVHGHDWTDPRNYYVRKNGLGRCCRVCNRERVARFKQRKKSQVTP